MGINNSWAHQHHRKKRSKWHRHRAQYVCLWNCSYRATSLPSLLLLRLLLQRLSDGITNEQTAGLAHGLHGVVIAGIEAHGQWALTQRLLPIRDAVLMLSEVFYRSHTLTRLHGAKASCGVIKPRPYPVFRD